MRAKRGREAQIGDQMNIQYFLEYFRLVLLGSSNAPRAMNQHIEFFNSCGKGFNRRVVAHVQLFKLNTRIRSILWGRQVDSYDARAAMEKGFCERAADGVLI